MMKPREFLQVDPASLHLPGSRRDGADPIKLHRQVAKYLPGTPIVVEVTGELTCPVGGLPTVGDS